MLLVRSYHTFAPLPVKDPRFKDPRQVSLSSVFPSAVCFCGTILTVTRTGRYPASLVFREPGLSSDRSASVRNCLRSLFPLSSLISDSEILVKNQQG